jgi:two-component system, NarL family, sensor histidine kinase BarA
MLNRIRRLNISLAAKCQLLFGSAVILIIAAALFVPWQRMDHLTEQLNTVAAGRVADSVMRQHALTGLLPSPEPAALHPSRGNESELPVPRIVSLTPNPKEPLTAWEQSVLFQLRTQPKFENLSRLYPRRDGSYGFRFAQPLLLQNECLRCHSPVNNTVHAPTAVPATPTTHATTKLSPAEAHLTGFVSVDIPSQIRINEVLLNRVFLLTAGMLSGTLAIIVFYFITTRLILQPVRVLQETAEKVSKGDLNIRSDINTRDEFQQLSETFNTMLTNLNRSAEQLRSINKSLDIKVGQLAESNVALYESNRLKSEFLANVSHELRTPLNSILGFAELLKDFTANDNKSARYVTNILQSGKNLLDLINDLLDLAKIEAGRMEVRSEPLSLNDLFEGLTSILKPVTEPKHLILKSSTTPDVPIIQTDPPKLQQVLYNFLSNAIKFSPPNGQIELKANVEFNNQIRISVTDHGPGIEPDKQNLIFEKFRQIDGSVTRQHSGTGLGLAISKELTSLLEGTIGVRSNPGEGATFWILLPQQIQPSIKDVRGRLVIM